MSRIKSRVQTEICGDCGASDPSWASINRGILLCAECCSVHRSLGRHISQVKSLRQGKWTPSVLNLVNSLTSLGVNTSVWEHSLQDAAKYPKNGRKPQPKDAVHPNKAEFIRAKHVNFNFVLKPAQDGDWQGNLESELNRQLHASVRAPNLETSLRLLSQGADPNFYHEEKGSTPLHMAARSGQAMQVELLLIFGADILVPDSNQQTAIDLAKANKHLAIAERLTEATYEVTDRLCYFLCNRRPDHAANQHIIVPDQNGVDISEPLKIARGKLLLIPNKMFEELVMDLYDEVDRRETESIWSTSALNPEIGAVPFLPVNPLLSATRNQGRQKLARFSAAQFAGLLTDVLIDAKRRQNMANLRPSLSESKDHPLRRCSNLSDDEPVYDAVASDDDYAALAPVALQDVFNVSPAPNRSTIVTEEEVALKKQLEESQQVIHDLQNKIQRLAIENTELKSRIKSQAGEEDEIVDLRPHDINGKTNGDDHSQLAAAGSKRPVSMYEAREKPPIKFGFTENRATTSLFQMDAATKESLPLNEEVKRHTNIVTRRIQELVTGLMDLSSPNNSFVPYGDQIRLAVDDLCAIFPPKLTDEGIVQPLQLLRVNSQEMQLICGKLTESLLAPGTEMLEATLMDVRQSAYTLARAIKDLVTRFEI